MNTPGMTAEQAVDIADAMTQCWAAPVLMDVAFNLLIVAILDSGLTYAEAEQGIRTLMQEVHPFRPQVAELVAATGRNKPAYHKPFLVPALEEAPLSKDAALSHVAKARAALRGEG